MTLLWSILGDNFCDPRISRIEKNLAKFCLKFLDLYASIYGNCDPLKIGYFLAKALVTHGQRYYFFIVVSEQYDNF